MQKKKLFWSILFLLVLAAGLGVIFYLYLRFSRPKPAPPPPKALTQIFIEAAKKIKSRWELGDLEGNFTKGRFHCPQEIVYSPRIDDLYLRCNPNYLQCFFEGKAGTDHPEMKISYQRKTYTVKPLALYPPKESFSSQKRFYNVITRSTVEGAEVPRYGIMMTLGLEEHPEYTLKMVLEDTCHDSYLPQRIYAYGSPTLYFSETEGGEGIEEEKKEDWIWDNFSRDIFVDKFMVTFRDVIEWIEYGGGPSHLALPKDPVDWAGPATGLTLKDMEKYCAFRGKQVMAAHIYDAATFYPADLDNPRPQQIMRGPFPWSRKRKEISLFPAMDHLEEGERIKTFTHQCRLSYVSECARTLPLPL